MYIDVYEALPFVPQKLARIASASKVWKYAGVWVYVCLQVCLYTSNHIFATLPFAYEISRLLFLLLLHMLKKIVLLDEI